MEQSDLIFMREAYEQALKSNDPSTQNGAVLVKGGMVIGRGYNHFPHGMEETPARWTDRDFKYPLIVHAETDAIYDAIRNGQLPMGGTLYVAWGVCRDCAKVVIELRLDGVVCHQIAAHDNQQPVWAKSIEDAFNWLQEAHVAVRHVHGDVGAEIRLNGAVAAV